jgi:hypothetical protein
MSTIPANVSLVTATVSTAPATRRRLPRLAGWMLTAAIAGALWYGVIEMIRLAF